jgi:general secretion pathway protein L
MFREFFTWWIGQLWDLVPERWGRLGSLGADALVIEPAAPLSQQPEGIAVDLRRHGRETSLGHFSLAGDALAELPRPPGNRVALRLRQRDVLAKTVTLPLAAEHHLHQALAFQMDQETPFSTDEIYWSHAIAARDRQNGRLSVRLLLVPRQSLAPLLRALDHLGIAPNWAEIADGPDKDRTLPLDGDDSASDIAPRRALTRVAAAACCLLLAIGTVATPFARQAIALAGVERQIAASRATASEVERVRGELDRLSGSIGLVESERDKAGRPLAILATLTRILPDDTYLTEVTAQQRKVTLSGRSAAAASLIGALSSGGGLRNVAFAAPVTRLEAIHVEMFTITAEEVAP